LYFFTSIPIKAMMQAKTTDEITAIAQIGNGSGGGMLGTP
jgi:hypothetical protein